MSKYETNHNGGIGNRGKLKQNAEKPRDSEYNVPTLLIDSSKDPHKNFHRGNLLGTGGFAKVFLVKEEASKKSFADKIISKAIFQRRNSAKQKVQREISLHRRMRHINVINFHGFFEDQSYVHILLELAPQKTLLHVNKYRKIITECEVRYYIKQIMAGTRYIHSQQVLHRDLKLGNMFLSSNMIVKIGDFGLATTFVDNKPGSLCGTPNYIAPEVLAKQGHSTASEVWSIGCMLYALLCGAPPFETESVSTTYQLISNCDYKIPSHVSLEAKEILQSMLCPDPSLRGCLTEPPPTSRGVNLQVNSFLVDGFTPAKLPCSALNTTPVFDDDTCPASNCQNIVEKKSSALKIPILSKVDHSTGCGSFSPIFSPTKLFGSFFAPKKKFLEHAITSLEACLAVKKEDTSEENLVEGDLMIAPVFVSKWVDYTNKYGFGFQMSDGNVGVLFNDKTMMGANAEFSQVQFTDLNGKTFSLRGDENANHAYPELQDRMDILKYYVDYMNENLADSITFLPGMETKRNRQKSKIPMLKLWSRRENYVAMELSNYMVQVNHMSDHVKVVIWSYERRLLATLFNNMSSQTICLGAPCPVHLRARLESTLPEIKELSRQKESQ